MSTEFPEEQPGRPAPRRGGLRPHPGAAPLRRRPCSSRSPAPSSSSASSSRSAATRSSGAGASALGFVLLILVHELGHYVEARRQGLNPQIPVFIPFLGAYVALRNQPFDPVAERARLGRRAGRRRRRGARLPRLRQRDRLGPAARARLLRLPPQPVQPDPDRVPRRRPHPPRLARPPRGRRRVEPGRGAAPRRRRRRLLGRARRGARDRHGRVARPAEPAVNGELDRRLLQPRPRRRSRPTWR